MIANIIEIILLTSIFSVLIPLIFYLLKIKKLPRENHVIGIIVILSAVVELIIATKVQTKQSTTLVSNVYFFLVFGLLCYYYYEVVFQFKSRLYFFTGIVIYVITIIYFGMQEGLAVYQGKVWAISGFILVIFGTIYNNYQVEKPPLLDKNLYSGLIFNAAIIFYFSFNFSLFLLFQYVATEISLESTRMAWAFHNVNNIIKNIAFAFGLYYTNRRRLNLTDEEVEKIQWKHLR